MTEALPHTPIHPEAHPAIDEREAFMGRQSFSLGPIGGLEPIDSSLLPKETSSLSGDVVASVRVNLGIGGHLLVVRRAGKNETDTSLAVARVERVDGGNEIHILGTIIADELPLTVTGTENTHIGDTTSLAFSVQSGELRISSKHNSNEIAFPTMIGQNGKRYDVMPRFPKDKRNRRIGEIIFEDGRGSWRRGTVDSGHPYYGPAVMRLPNGEKIGIHQDAPRIV